LTIDSPYRRLWRIEKSFRMSKHDLRARPIYHHKRALIEAHLSIVFAALAVTKFVEDRNGWSIKKFVRTARRYRTVPANTSSPPKTPFRPTYATHSPSSAERAAAAVDTNLSQVGASSTNPAEGPTERAPAGSSGSTGCRTLPILHLPLPSH